MNLFGGQILDHDQAHESNANGCLSSATGRQKIGEMEAITGSEDNVLYLYQKAWSEFFRGPLSSAPSYAPPVLGTANFWMYRWWGSNDWTQGNPPQVTHNNNSSC